MRRGGIPHGTGAAAGGSYRVTMMNEQIFNTGAASTQYNNTRESVQLRLKLHVLYVNSQQKYTINATPYLYFKKKNTRRLNTILIIFDILQCPIIMQT